ncbi:TlpA family protein disulfide reductase [Fertoebacter nigrum]|uniref:TlpA family protein disulfide reductase n=1 Tax=Fertoeibacter niger TaxID=2656921 RepID=A0A8X8GUV8_9RHOB|nr:TlpA disulfide reductase family protein [Fertoeibacter niger]NUB44763.1 TlpA family protein disulfide reductase [Fertoeibacter niger]
MLRLVGAVLYTALMFGANGVAAQTLAAADAARDGDMRKLGFHAEARELPEVELLGLDDSPRSLSDYKGKWVVLNFWATWCPPCRKEMPGLDRLEAELGGDALAVVTVATGRNAVPAIEKFFASAGVTHLPALRDPTSELARNMGIMGLPVTVILNPEGAEVGRLIGDAEWDSPEARAVLGALMAGG